VTEVASRWYVSFGCEVHRRVGSPTHPGQVVGVDVGVKALVVISTGEVVDNPKPLLRHAKRMARQRRRLARQQTGGRGESASMRSRRTRQKIARTHAKVAHVRADALHKLPSAGAPRRSVKPALSNQVGPAPLLRKRGCAKRLHMFQATVASGAWPHNRPNPAPRSWRSRLSGTHRSWRR